MQVAVTEASVVEHPSLQVLFQEHHDSIYWAAYRVTGNEMDAEDAVQTVFMRLARRDELPDLSEYARGYFQRAAVNAALDIVRARGKRRGVTLDDVAGILAGPAEDRPDERQSSEELKTWLRRAVSDLSPRAAEVFILHFFQGYGNREIAEMLGTSQSTIAVTLHRTRRRLADQLEAFFGGTDEH